MNASAVFTTPAASSNFTTYLLWQMMSRVDISVFGINALFGLPTHSYVIWLIIKGTGSGIASEFFNLNLSVCEMIYSLNCLLFVLSIVFQSLLRISLFFMGMGITGRPLFQCLICVDRYLAVVHPVTFLKFKPLRYKVICCIVVWIICLGACLACVFVLNSPNFFKLTWLASLKFFAFLSIQLFCCLAVLRALKQSGPVERGREEENHMKRRAFYLILLTTVTTCVLFVPYIVTGVLAVLQKDISVSFSISLFCFIMAAFVHPFLYLCRKGKLNLCCVKNRLF